MAMQPGNTGAQLMSYGMTSYFKPWYFDGRIVYWGDPEHTQSAALDAADRMRTSVRRGNFIRDWH
jgi:hypothetical protein